MHKHTNGLLSKTTILFAGCFFLSLGVFATIPKTANAENLNFYFHRDSKPNIIIPNVTIPSVTINDTHPNIYFDDSDERYQGEYDERRVPQLLDRDFCPPNQAMRNAHRLGVRHAKIITINPDMIVISGILNDQMQRIAFANRVECSRIR